MPAPPDPHATHPLALGEQFAPESKTLGERRVINVYVPPDYAKTDTKYPVLYMPDGGAGEDFPQISGLVDVSIKNGVIKPMIVVGVENTERRRDLVGATDIDDEKKIAPHAGGSGKFRAFLRDELKPAIAARYRITGESALVGESFAGLFVVETLLVEPALFDSYIAVDPSVWWNKRTLVEQTPIPTSPTSGCSSRPPTTRTRRMPSPRSSAGSATSSRSPTYRFPTSITRRSFRSRR